MVLLSMGIATRCASPAAVSWKNSKSRRQENCCSIQSEDPKVAAAGIQIRSGRKWSAKRVASGGGEA